MDLKRIKQLAGLNEMDSQGYTGRRDAPVELGGPETTVRPDALQTPDQAVKSAMPARDKSVPREQWFATQGVEERAKLLYMWVKQGAVNQRQFNELLELHVNEELRDRDMEKFD